MKGNRKGQAALDFLMTYGWAIALVVIIAATLFALGVFDVSNFVGSKAAGFSGVAVSAWRMDPAGTFTLQLNNQAGVKARVDYINVTVASTTANVTGVPVTLNPGDSSGTLTTATGAFGAQATGTSYTAKVIIGYTDLNSNFAYVSSGTTTGKAA
ncbi:MAG: hypothetical protein KGH63_02060 [Candidatus Micrarchaeota archaeon]|nr:hypothetical protein [Candidatus Micrarchaeota archaeon]